MSISTEQVWSAFLFLTATEMRWKCTNGINDTDFQSLSSKRLVILQSFVHAKSEVAVWRMKSDSLNIQTLPPHTWSTIAWLSDCLFQKDWRTQPSQSRHQKPFLISDPASKQALHLMQSEAWTFISVSNCKAQLMLSANNSDPLDSNSPLY